MKCFLAISCALICQITIAAPTQFEFFANSLEKEVFIKKNRIMQIGNFVKVKKPGFFDRLGSGEAYYKPLTNTIVLKEENLIGSGRYLRIKSSFEMNEGKSYNFFAAKAETIFHEIAHGELDTIIERDNTHPLNYLLFNTIANWIKGKYRSVNAKTAVHELYGYSAGNIVQTLYGDLETILIAYGIRPHNLSCFSKKALENIAKNRDLHNELKFKQVSNKEFIDDFIPRYIFIKGKDYKIPQKDFKLSWKKSLFHHFVKTYNIPRNSLELIERMNVSRYHKVLQKCYKAIVAD